MRTTNKKDMELYYRVHPDTLREVRLNSDVIVYIPKDADITGKHLIRMYSKNGHAIVHKLDGHKEYTPVMLHPDQICTHDRATWKTYNFFWGAEHDYCPICTPMEEQ